MSACHYCGVVGGNTTNQDRRILKYNGIDRVNNDLGYIGTNVVGCCGTCNLAKQSMTIEEFADWIVRVQTHLNLTGWKSRDTIKP